MHVPFNDAIFKFHLRFGLLINLSLPPSLPPFFLPSYGHVFVSQGEDRLGSKYKKAVYRAYKNGVFMEHKKRTARELHLQILGEKLG